MLRTSLNRGGNVFRRMETQQLQHDKTNEVACAPRKDSDQPEHPLFSIYSTYKEIKICGVQLEKDFINIPGLYYCPCVTDLIKLGVPEIRFHCNGQPLGIKKSWISAIINSHNNLGKQNTEFQIMWII